LDDQVDELAKQAARVPEEPTGYEQLRAEIQREEKTVDELGTQLHHKQVELNASARISAYQDAELMRKDNKKQMLATAAAPLAVLFAVCTAVAWLDHRKRRIRSAGQVSRGLGIRVVGAVPARANLARELAAHAGDEGHPALESIDALRTLLLH